MSSVNRDAWGGVPVQPQARPVPDGPLFLWRGERRAGLLHRREDLLPANLAGARARGDLNAVLLADASHDAETLSRMLDTLWQRPRRVGLPGEMGHHHPGAWDLFLRSRGPNSAPITEADQWRR